MNHNDDIQSFLAGKTPFCDTETRWADGKLPLGVRYYLSNEQPPEQYVTSVRSVVLKDESVLVLRNREGYHVLPGGGVDPGESPWGALVREIEEETGLEAAPVHLSGVYSKPDSNEIVFSFFCRMTGGAVRLTDEADRIEYFPPDRIPRNTVPKRVERIRDFFSDRAGTHYRVQSGPSAIELLNKGKL